jgi:uroporphyrinogen decarboxylase
MNSRERVMAAMEHKQPDRVPIDFGAHRSSGINAMAYARLKKRLKVSSGDIYVYDLVQQLAIVEKPVLDYFRADAIEMGRGFMLDDSEWKDWTLPDGTPCKVPRFVNLEKAGDDWHILAPDGRRVGVQKKGCVFFEQTYWPLKETDFEHFDFSSIAEQFKNTSWTGVATPGAHLALDEKGLRQLAAGAKKLRESTDRAIIGLFGGNLFETPQMMFGMENYLAYMAQYPEQTLQLSEALCNHYMANLEKWLPAVGPCIDIVLFGDDLGATTGPLLSPAMYRRYYKPFHKKMWKRVKELADVKIQLHSCGAIEPFLEDLIDAGLDSINPVQTNTKGMEPEILKKKYGDRLCLWGGGCDTARILPRGTPIQVAEHVKKQVDILKPGGGFVFQQIHNIMSEVPPENIIAMFEAVNG